MKKISIEDMDRLCENDRLINLADHIGMSEDELKNKIVNFFLDNYNFQDITRLISKSRKIK